MSDQHKIHDARVVEGALHLCVDGQVLAVPLRTQTRRLSDATNEQLTVFDISPSGYGLYWPLLDEDISVDGLLGIPHRQPIFKQAA